MNLVDIRNDYLLPELGGAGPALVDLHLRRTIIDFCNETGVFTELMPPVDVVAGDYDYAVSPATADTEVVRAWSVWYGSDRLYQSVLAPLEDARRQYPAPGRPAHYAVATPGVILLYPTPAENLAGGLTARLWLRPSDDATAIPDWLGSRYLDAFAAGTKARLMAMAEKPWSNPEQAALYRGEYIRARTDARVEAYRSFEMAELQVRFRRP